MDLYSVLIFLHVLGGVGPVSPGSASRWWHSGASREPSRSIRLEPGWGS
jgi:hypothetical protein